MTFWGPSCGLRYVAFLEEEEPSPPGMSMMESAMRVVNLVNTTMVQTFVFMDRLDLDREARKNETCQNLLQRDCWFYEVRFNQGAFITKKPPVF